MRLVASLLVAGLGAPFVISNGAPSGPQPKVAVDTTIVLHTTSSSMEFDPPAIAVKQGKRVLLRFMNTGTLPHNLVLVRNEDDIDDLAAAATKVMGDFIPVAQKAKMIAHTTLASPGQTVEVTFVVPPPGEYTYVCLMTGHANTMIGKLRSLR